MESEEKLVLASLIKLFTVLIVTMPNTGKAPRYLILYINKKNPLRNSENFPNQSFVTKRKFALQLTVAYSNVFQKARVSKQNFIYSKRDRNIRLSLRLNSKPMLTVKGKPHILYVL